MKDVFEAYGEKGKPHIKKQALINLLNEHYGLEARAAALEHRNCRVYAAELLASARRRWTSRMSTSS